MRLPSVLVHDAAEQVGVPLGSALRDLAKGVGFVELWGTMGWLDVRQRYSRSVMGPFWVTLSLAAFVLGLGVTYGALFRVPLEEYLPYLTVGMVVWTLLSGILIEGCAVFTSAEAAIKQLPAPLSVHVFRLVWRSLIIFGHNVLIVVAVLAWFGINPGAAGLAAIPGLALIVLNGAGFALIFGTLSARFRDIPPLMANLVQMLFFVTPVLWRVESIGDRALIATLNPFYYLVEIVRSPLVGHPLPEGAWAVSLAFTAVNLAVALVCYARFRWRIPYWL